MTLTLTLTLTLRWRFFEQYEGKAGFEAHTKTEHFAAWEAFASSEPSPFSAPPEVRFFVEDSATSVCAGAAAVTLTGWG